MVGMVRIIIILKVYVNLLYLMFGNDLRNGICFMVIKVVILIYFM